MYYTFKLKPIFRELINKYRPRPHNPFADNYGRNFAASISPVKCSSVLKFASPSPDCAPVESFEAAVDV
ncbi:hypothetical protein BCON_0221g00180 [Botryotinia convoluta]|uniref:Uncharacterized protein n=1 Tax=Botryotinia convoluta TaxID=54673 RepID=A0A4Z1HJW5_9HELO|nr:hypothetical protein BCON_0221g00180 [Botryotinia convoluta]